MARDGFDDVGIRFMDDPEEPAPPRRPASLRKRMTIALSAAILAAGVLSAGASALTGSEESAGSRAGGSGATVEHNAEGVPFVRDGHKCHRGMGEKRDSAFSPSDY
jgi:hypothetical protein